MNHNEIKQTLLLYRPGSGDAGDPQIAEALALARGDAELSRWLDDHCARQSALRAKFRQVEPPAGLREQIISEHAASQRRNAARHKIKFALAGALAGGLVLLSILWWPRSGADNTLAIFQNDMARTAQSPYAMDLLANRAAPIRDYLAGKGAPADFVLPAGLERAALTGCAVEGWQGAKVSMVCFRTGRPLPPNAASDLWLFVVDRSALQNPPDAATPQLAKVAKVNSLITATWTQGDKVYFLGTEGAEADLRQYL